MWLLLSVIDPWCFVVLQAFEVNFANGSTRFPAPPAVPLPPWSPALLAHAALGFLAVSVVFPAGICALRLTPKPRVPASRGKWDEAAAPRWLVAHVTCQVSGVAMVIVSALAPARALQHSNYPMCGIHCAIGAVVVALASAQALVGWKRPSARYPLTVLRWLWAAAHRWTGVAVIVLGVAAVFTGFQSLQPAVGACVGCCCVVLFPPTFIRVVPRCRPAVRSPRTVHLVSGCGLRRMAARGTGVCPQGPPQRREVAGANATAG